MVRTVIACCAAALVAVIVLSGGLITPPSTAPSRLVDEVRPTPARAAAAPDEAMKR